jgi:hypothetical protein
MSLEIALERLAIEPRGVGILNEPAGRRHGAGDADADAVLVGDLLLERAHHQADGPDGRAVVVARRGHAMLSERLPAGAQHDPCDLGTAEVYAQA